MAALMRYKRGLTATEWIVIVNIAIFILVILAATFISEEIFRYVALQPAAIWQGQMLWTLLTSMFMHGNFFHLFVNMFSLFFIGSFLEGLVGKKKYLAIYFVGGLLGSVFFALSPLFTDRWAVMAVGASGAIFALGGALAVLTPRLPVFIMFIPIPIPMYIAIFLLFIVLSFLPNIANSGHLGGLVAGLMLGWYYKKDVIRRMRLMLRHQYY